MEMVMTSKELLAQLREFEKETMQTLLPKLEEELEMLMKDDVKSLENFTTEMKLACTMLQRKKAERKSIKDMLLNELEKAYSVCHSLQKQYGKILRQYGIITEEILSFQEKQRALLYKEGLNCEIFDLMRLFGKEVKEKTQKIIQYDKKITDVQQEYFKAREEVRNIFN